MKTVLKILCLMLFTMLCITSCGPARTPKKSPSTDSAKIARIVESIVNPSFTTVEELVKYQEADIAQGRLNEMFREMPDYILRSAATVCINRDKKVSKKSVVKEYINNSNVYDNLNGEPLSLSVKEDNNPPTETVSPPEPEVKNKNDSASDDIVRTVKDTIINGELITLIKYHK